MTMKNIFFIFLLFCAGFIVSSCSSGDIAPWKSMDVSNSSISLRRSGCFGTCPVYELSISGNGNVEFNGNNFVEFPGKHTITIPLDSLRILLHQIDTCGWFNLHDEYTNMSVSDAPSAIITVVIGSKTKTINHYHGDMSSPPILKSIERRIDEIARSAQFIGNGMMPKQPQD